MKIIALIIMGMLLLIYILYISYYRNCPCLYCHLIRKIFNKKEDPSSSSGSSESSSGSSDSGEEE